MPSRVLVVDDEPNLRKVLAAQLRRSGYTPEVAEDGPTAIERLTQEPAIDLIISDLRMPGMSGLELLRWVRTHRPAIPLLLLTAHGTVDTAVEAIKQGAFDYLSKPFDQSDLLQVVAKALASGRRADQALLEPQATRRQRLIGTTQAMRDVFTRIDKVAASPTTLLITGETGTGKELVAREIHDRSDRRERPFIAIHCGAIPESLFEAELFGFEKGSFTGATHAKPGKMELAHGGTLFLDEVAELPLALQVKFLRALQERVIDRVGGLRPLSVDVRVIAATHVDLRQAVLEGRFREDLYYRLNVVPIALPPLRARRADLPLLVEHFLAKYNERLGRTVTEVNPEAMAALLSHDWPGNVRELENVMERATLLADGSRVTLTELSGLPSLPAAPLPDQADLRSLIRTQTERLEREHIQRALEAEEGNVTRAARRLGISRKSLQLKMKDYGLREG